VKPGNSGKTGFLDGLQEAIPYFNRHENNPRLQSRRISNQLRTGGLIFWDSLKLDFPLNNPTMLAMLRFEVRSVGEKVIF
jgi:hypothetical protein